MRLAACLIACLTSFATAEERPLYAGSGSVAAVLAHFAGERFQREAAGSQTAAEALASGRALVVGLSRPLAADEAARLAATGPAPVARTLGHGALVVVAHRERAIAGIARAQLARAGDGLTWGELGVPALGTQPVTLVLNHAASGTTRLFCDLLREGRPPPDSAFLEPVGSSVAQAVAIDPLALGVVSLAHLYPAVRALPVDGVAPSPAAIRDGSYPLTRPLLLLWRPGAERHPALARLLHTLDEPGARERLEAMGVY